MRRTPSRSGTRRPSWRSTSTSMPTGSTTAAPAPSTSRRSSTTSTGRWSSRIWTAPDFSLPSTTGETVSLKQFKGKKTVILYFYPKDETPGCTKEACEFRDHTAEFEKHNAVILGISTDDLESHRHFQEKQKLPFPLLSDVDATVSKMFGVYKQKNLYGKKSMGIERTTFVIDRT